MTWRSLLEEFKIPTPINLSKDTATHADELWEKLSYQVERSDGFDLETLINLGKIDDLYFERPPQGETLATEHWHLTESEPEQEFPAEDVNHCQYTVDMTISKGIKKF